MTSTKPCFPLVTLLFLVVFVFQSCTTNQDIFIVIGEKASKTEQITAGHLKSDLEKVLEKQVRLISEKDGLPLAGQVLVIGTALSNTTIAGLAKNGSIILTADFPGSRGGIWATTNINQQKIAILAGSDVQGMQYAVYDYCKEILGVDPFEHWNGNKPAINPHLNLYNIPNRVISPPEIPILCYFENDCDELANIKEPKLEYDWKNYTEMINSLVRIRYNAIHLFDMLGRPEFFLRPEYKKIRPDYDVRISYLDSMINYAHDMGMKVQIDMALGYKIKPISQEKADCWSQYKQDWIDTWKYYLEETPISKADIFVLRPRNQIWDWEYKSRCGEDKIDVFNEVYSELGQIIDQYKPEAKKVVICYHDGMEMFNNGFSPPEDWTVVWCDDGWAGFEYLPESTKGYDFGTYMHAGFWLNHAVHDPCPVRLDTIMKQMVNGYGANKYCLVNGQQFRPFLLNLEAFSEIAKDVNAFDGQAFYDHWATHHFGQKAGRYAVNSMKKLHEAQHDKVGYVEHLWEIREAFSYLCNAPIQRPGKTPIPYEYGRVENDYEQVAERASLIDMALKEAKKGAEMVGFEKDFYHDYILFPVEMFANLLSFERELHQIAKYKKLYEDTGDKEYLKHALDRIDLARLALTVVCEQRRKGDNNPDWEGWYKLENRRPNNGFPTQEMLDAVESNLNSLR